MTLAIGVRSTSTCTFTETVAGDAGSVHTNRATATVTDDENNPVTGSDDATVTVTDVVPTILVDKDGRTGAAPGAGR